MQKKDTLIIDASDAIKNIKDRLKVLFHDDVFPDLVFQLAVDAWNIRFTCENSDDDIIKMVTDRVMKYLSGNEIEKNEIITLIVSCIKDILLDIGMTIYTAIPEGINHVMYHSTDQFNNLIIKLVYDDLDYEN